MDADRSTITPRQIDRVTNDLIGLVNDVSGYNGAEEDPSWPLVCLAIMNNLR